MVIPLFRQQILIWFLNNHVTAVTSGSGSVLGMLKFTVFKTDKPGFLQIVKVFQV